jgi:hypothetical protein
MKTSNSDFKHQDKFLNDKPLLSYCDVFDNHGLTPEILKNRDTAIIFSESKIYTNGELISDFICRLKSGLYLYLSIYGQSVTFKLRVYYSQEQRTELDFLINGIKRQIKDGTINVRADKTEDK